MSRARARCASIVVRGSRATPTRKWRAFGRAWTRRASAQRTRLFSQLVDRPKLKRLLRRLRRRLQFGRLKALSQSAQIGRRRLVWVCVCVCVSARTGCARRALAYARNLCAMRSSWLCARASERASKRLAGCRLWAQNCVDRSARCLLAPVSVA